MRSNSLCKHSRHFYRRTVNLRSPVHNPIPGLRFQVPNLRISSLHRVSMRIRVRAAKEHDRDGLLRCTLHNLYSSPLSRHSSGGGERCLQVASVGAQKVARQATALPMFQKSSSVLSRVRECSHPYAGVTVTLPEVMRAARGACRARAAATKNSLHHPTHHITSPVHRCPVNGMIR